MQRSSGSFSYWEGCNSSNRWSTIYASHFMVEARNAGLDVDNGTWNNMLYNLNNLSQNDRLDGDYYGGRHNISHSLYTLYVLALAKENVLSRLNWMRDNAFEAMRPHDKARLAASYALLGRAGEAKNLIPPASELSFYDKEYRRSYGGFRSNVRDMAMLLDALVAVDPDSKLVDTLIKNLVDRMNGGRWYNTQDNAFAFLAIGKAMSIRGGFGGATNVVVRLGDGTTVPFNKELLLRTPDLLKGDVRLEVEGGALQYAWEVIGVEKEKQSLQTDKGLEVRRRYLDKDGEPLKMDEVRQGDLVVVEITLKTQGASSVENVAVVDLLPTGLEIENARLSTSAAVSWIKSTAQADYVDIRDDRLNLYLTVLKDKRVYYYTTRAVTVGNFTVPNIHAEAMYDPSVMSESGRQKLKVLPPLDALN